uniref:Uncharacterized protein n=1 Tax=Heliothis virescens TaxID=7102 RepID=A0A2A4K484_HELVI
MHRLPVRRPRYCSRLYFNKPICPCERVTPEPQKEYPVPRPWVTFTGDEDQSFFDISADMASLEVQEAAKKRAKKEAEPVDEEPSVADSDDSFDGETSDSNDDDFTESDSDAAEACGPFASTSAEGEINRSRGHGFRGVARAPRGWLEPPGEGPGAVELGGLHAHGPRSAEQRFFIEGTPL